MIRYETLDIPELERRLRAIDEEEINKIKKIREAYHHSKVVIKQLMEEQVRGGVRLHKEPVKEEDDEIDKSKFFQDTSITIIV